MMNNISELTRILKDSFHWNKARLECFTRMLLALFAVRTVNLSELAIAFCSPAQRASRYKRIKRFFRYFTFDNRVIAQWIMALFFSGDRPYYLILDRTQWYWGKAKINIFTLAVAYEGVAIPVLWLLLPKAGSTSGEEQIAMVNRFIEIFGAARISGILADREFDTSTFLQALSQQGLSFYIRVKKDTVIFIKNKRFLTIKKLFSHLSPKHQYVFPMKITYKKTPVYLVGSRSETGELMVVATNQLPKSAIAIYLRRWEIETLFSCLKGRGFRFEDTHLTQLDRIEKLMALLAVGFCWAHKTGEWRATGKPIPWNKHRFSRRPQSSFFRYGFDFIREMILQPFKKPRLFKKILSLLHPPTQTISLYQEVTI
jgi:hypothetical protein